MIQVKNLKKTYGSVTAVKGISFHVEKGSFFAFLGPNGAGKSTTINILSTLLKPDEGEVLIGGSLLGRDDDAIRHKIGVVFQQNMLDKRLSVYENLDIRGSFYGLSQKELKQRIKELTDQLSMTKFLHQKYGSLSGGQRRRADIARALIHRPQILFLDEPTTGLDPQTRQTVWQVIKDLRHQDMTIFLTTHYMEETLRASHVIILDEGEIKAEGTPDELRQTYTRDVLKLHGNTPLIESILKDKGIEYKMDGTQVLAFVHDLDAIPLLSILQPHLEGFEMLKGTMDDVFIHITGKELRE